MRSVPECRSFQHVVGRESAYEGGIVQSNLQLYTHVTSQLPRKGKGAIHCKITA